MSHTYRIATKGGKVNGSNRSFFGPGRLRRRAGAVLDKPPLFFAGNYFLRPQWWRVLGCDGGALSFTGAVRHPAHPAGQLRVRHSGLRFSAADQIDLRRVIGYNKAKQTSKECRLPQIVTRILKKAFFNTLGCNVK